MSYKLADGTLSTDYKVGDLFEVVHPGYILKEGCFLFLYEDDLSDCPLFKDKKGTTHAFSWAKLKAVNSDLIINLKNLSDSERKQAEELAEKSKLPLTEWRGLKVRANPPLSELPKYGDCYFSLEHINKKGYCSLKCYRASSDDRVLKRKEMFATEQDAQAYVQAMIDAGWWEE